ncbi:MAG: Hpt domain-containing protein [Rhodocyclaceae bacterium]|nr:Hpt domain-containing protein [Rhodocyclaceae bacterium]
MSNAAELDIGPLTWVKGEIDLALDRAAEALRTYAANPAEESQLKFAQTHLHQAHGALAIVGLEGITQFSESLEQLLGAVERGTVPFSAEVAAAAQEGLQAIHRYLDDLLAGDPDQPLRLFPAYAKLIEARGEAKASPGDLFFPDLSLRPPRREEEPAVPGGTELNARLRLARYDFQRGLLQWLRGDAAGLGTMRRAVASIEDTQALPAARAFWWAAQGFIDALAAGGVAAETGTRRLCARIDIQMRKLIEGSRSVAERLMRDVLYQVAVSTSGGAHVDRVRGAYRLSDLLPAKGEPDLALSAVRPLRELLAQTKEDWNRFSAGAAIALPQFHERSAALADQARQLGQVDLSRLVSAVAAVANMLRKDPLAHNESVALEVATALLLVEHALDNPGKLGVDFARQVDVVTGRLNALLKGETLAAMAVPHLDEIAQRAQERLLMSQVAREVLTNLAQIEQTLDGFFRNPAKAPELESLAKPLKQVDGALAILGQTRASEVLRQCGAKIAEFAQPSYEARQADFEDVANKLSALGFFIDALQHGPADLEAILNPAPRVAPEAEEEAPSVEAQLIQTARETQALAEALRDKPQDEALRVELRQNLETLRDDASLVADADLERQAAVALQAVSSLEAAPTEAATGRIEVAVETLASVAAGAPAAVAPSPEAARLVDASSDEIDAELLGIFIEEAHEVLAAIAAALPESRAAPHDRETLTVIRRGFHTLKGSGRMVGLGELGETAWAVEQVLNRWLQMEMDATPALHGMIEQAHGLFAEWVAQMEAGGGTHRDTSGLAALCEQLKKGGTAEAAPAEPAPAAPPEAAPAGEVAIGTTKLSAPLFHMYLEEAQGHLAVLEREEPSRVPTQERIRAAHTLASTSATVGFEPLHTLAHALELALVRLAGAGAAPDDAAAQVLADAREALTGMAAEVTVQEFPAGREDLVTALDGIGAGEIAGAPSPETGIPPASEEAAAIAAPVVDMELLAPDAGPPEDAIEITLPEPAAEALVELAPIEIPGPGPAPESPEAAPAVEALAEPVTAAEHAAPVAPEPVPAAADSTPPMPEPVVAPEPAAETAPEPLPAAEPAAEAAETATPQQPATPAEDRRHLRLQDDLDPQLVPLFLEEAQDLMTEIAGGLREWHGRLDSADVPDRLKRLLHTLKGSARMAGAMGVGELIHSMETRIEQAQGAGTIRDGFVDELEASFDRATSLVERIRHGGEAAPEPGAAAPPAAEAEPAPPAGAADEVPEAAPAQPATPTPAKIAPFVLAAEPAAERAEAEQAAARAVLRVRADFVDRLANEAGEMAIARARIEGEMRALKGSLLELTENVFRLRGQLREIEIQAESQMQSRQAEAAERSRDFDPLEFDRFTRFQELTRMMAESVNDVTTIQHNLLRNLDHADAAIAAQARLNRELSQGLMGVRMVPFNSLADRLHRVVRQTAKELDRRASLDLRGGQTELDRSVLEKMTGPLEHLLRNAIAHGLEPPAERQAAGKPEIGEIVLRVSQAGNEITIELADDGRGLDFARIRARALERGLLTEEEAADESRLTGAIFLPGFSTAETLTATAGRGVGMDVVRNETGALGGRIETQTTPGRGTRFLIYLPLTLAVTQAVLVRVGNRTYALSSTMVEQVQELKPEATEKIRAAGFAEWLGNPYAYHYLPNLLGDAAARPQVLRRHWVLLVRAGGLRVALEVDALTGNQEVVVKNIGPQLARVVGIVGATVLGDGEVALIINPVALAARAPKGAAPHAAEEPAAAPATTAEPATAPVVMVVDDSLTVRKITGRLLAREGYQVLTAKDGVDALEQALDIVPDVMLVDIEMPRMDGFDLTRNLRADPRLKDVPIIMITSRIADKHRNYAKEIGVNHYLGKPYDEDELLRLIAGYVNRAS